MERLAAQWKAWALCGLHSSRDQDRVLRLRQRLWIIERIMKAAALVAGKSAADDEVGDLDQVPKFDEIGSNPEVGVIVLHFLAQHVDPVLGALEPLGRPDDPDIVPHEP